MKKEILDARLLQELKQIVGSANIKTGEEIHNDFSHDEMPEYGRAMPLALVEGTSTEQISALMRFAHKHALPVTPRGSGTGLCGGCVPINGGILLSLAGMAKIIEIDTENLVVTTQPGVLLMHLAAEVEKHGLFYPPDPGEKSATIGGNVMTNAGGMRAIRYGVTRDYVLGMEVVLPNGEVMQLGGKIVKNSSGYSLKDLMIGSEGTLGIVTQITLKLIRRPDVMVTMLIPFTSLTECLACVPKVLASAITPCNLEFMEKEVILKSEDYLGVHFPDKTAAAYLMVSYEGTSREEIDKTISTVAAVCIQNGALDALISDSPERQDSIWKPRGAFLEAIKSSTPAMDECDVVLPINKVAEYVTFAQKTAADKGVRIASFGHAGDGNLHIYICKDDYTETVWLEKQAAVMNVLYARAKEIGGQVSGEHGIGHAKKVYLEQSAGGVAMQLMQGIKTVFDPKNIMNPGKVVSPLPSL